MADARLLQVLGFIVALNIPVEVDGSPAQEDVVHGRPLVDDQTCHRWTKTRPGTVILLYVTFLGKTFTLCIYLTVGKFFSAFEPSVVIKAQWAAGKRLGVQCLAQGHLDI